jgi:hypothetical protein
MNWGQFWEQPVISYGGLLFLGACVWVVRLIERAHAEHREAIRRYEEKYPFGEVKTRYEREYEGNE